MIVAISLRCPQFKLIIHQIKSTYLYKFLATFHGCYRNSKDVFVYFPITVENVGLNTSKTESSFLYNIICAQFLLENTVFQLYLV